MEKQQITANIKAVKDGKLTGAVASTGDVDRDGESINPNGWNLENFKKNPVILFGHDPHSLPIGKATDIRMQGNELLFDAEFAVKENPFAKMVSEMFEGKFLNTFSVGFLPQEQGDDGRIESAELLEISAVGVPSNPNAVATRSAEANIEMMYKSFKKPELKPVKITDSEEKDIKNFIDQCELVKSAAKAILSKAIVEPPKKAVKPKVEKRTSNRQEEAKCRTRLIAKTISRSADLLNKELKK